MFQNTQLSRTLAYLLSTMLKKFLLKFLIFKVRSVLTEVKKRDLKIVFIQCKRFQTLLWLLFGRGGMISSECLAGYWCKSGSSNNLINRTIEFQNCSANEDCSGLCPKGHYCPQGVDLPLPCPEHTYRDTEGAETPDQCAPCPAGSYCPSGNDWQLLLLMTVKFNISNWITNKILYLK